MLNFKCRQLFIKINKYINNWTVNEIENRFNTQVKPKISTHSYKKKSQYISSQSTYIFRSISILVFSDSLSYKKEERGK